MNVKYKAVLFDFDGTLFDTSEGIFSSVIYALKCFGLEETDKQRLNYFIGPPLYHSFMHQYGVDGNTAEKMIEKYREHYKTCGVYQSKPYDGAHQALKTLFENKVKIAIASAKPELFVTQLLKRNGIYKYFSAISAVGFNEKLADKAVIIKKAVDASGLTLSDGILMVGDRVFDIEGANKNGIASAGALYGFGSKAELEKAGATYLIESIGEVPEIVLI